MKTSHICSVKNYTVLFPDPPSSAILHIIHLTYLIFRSSTPIYNTHTIPTPGTLKVKLLYTDDRQFSTKGICLEHAVMGFSYSLLTHIYLFSKHTSSLPPMYKIYYKYTSPTCNIGIGGPL